MLNNLHRLLWQQHWHAHAHQELTEGKCLTGGEIEMCPVISVCCDIAQNLSTYQKIAVKTG